MEKRKKAKKTGNESFGVLHRVVNSMTSEDMEVPEPENCPVPHSAANTSRNFLSVPQAVTPDNSFRSSSSRNNYLRVSGDFTKRTNDNSKRSTSSYGSPKNTDKEIGRILHAEQKVKEEKEKYKQLERKYKDLLMTQSQNQLKFENMVEELQKLIEQKKNKVSNETIAQDLQVIKGQIERLEKIFDIF